MKFNNLLLAILFISSFTSFNYIYSANYKEIADLKQFNKIYSGKKPTVIMYSSKTCQPCKSMEPNFDTIAREFPEIQFFKLDTSKKEFSSIVKEKNIMGLPTLTYSKDSKEYKRDRKGAMLTKEIRQSVQEFLKLISPKNNTKSNSKKTKSVIKKSAKSKKPKK